MEVDKEWLVAQLLTLQQEEVKRAKEGKCLFYNAAIVDVLGLLKS